jgi:hypothetical protein
MTRDGTLPNRKNRHPPFDVLIVDHHFMCLKLGDQLVELGNVGLKVRLHTCMYTFFLSVRILCCIVGYEYV